MKGNKESLYKYIGIKRKGKDHGGPFVSGAGNLMRSYKEKTEVLNALFVSVFTGKACPQVSQVPEPSSRICGSKPIPTVEEERVRDHLSLLCIHKSMGPDGMHLRVFRELANDLVMPYCIIFEMSWQVGRLLITGKRQMAHHL